MFFPRNLLSFFCVIFMMVVLINAETYEEGLYIFPH